MCGIVGAVSKSNIVPVLLDGLRRLEYRGYDSAGLVVIDDTGALNKEKVADKIAMLAKRVNDGQLSGTTGIGHTRWATHGKPSVLNAHPHICRDQVAIVHNGIIENHEKLREHLKGDGYSFVSETDSEVIANHIHSELEKDKNLLEAVISTVTALEGAYAIGIIAACAPQHLIVARNGSPLVIGIGVDEYFIASDLSALLPVTKRFIFLEDGDIAEIGHDLLRIYDQNGKTVERPIQHSDLSLSETDKLGFRHYMLKEIHDQPSAIANTLSGRLEGGVLAKHLFGDASNPIFKQVSAIQIVACGTSYHAGLIAKYWFEDIAHIPCQVEVASEFRYRNLFITENTLFVAISQSGETADTLAALQKAKADGFLSTLCICNVAESSITRTSDLVFLTRAGAEIGVASTKAFSTQLVALLLLVVSIAKQRGIANEITNAILFELETLAETIAATLKLDDPTAEMSKQFVDKHHALYLGRGVMLPVAMEGALKLKETSYIHAEAYPAGELKHGPLALVDDKMPVISVAPNNLLLKKLKSNLHEVNARGGKLYVITDASDKISADFDMELLKVPPVGAYIAPIVYTVPLQLLSYHVAVLKGADVDQPRNLAKSVTVE